MSQLHKRQVFAPIHPQDLTKNKKQKTERYENPMLYAEIGASFQQKPFWSIDVRGLFSLFVYF